MASLKPVFKSGGTVTAGNASGMYDAGAAVVLMSAERAAEIGAVQVIELNEAFAAQALAVIDDLGLDEEKVNPNGGAIALGHPIGATGAANTAKILDEMECRDLELGLVTLCIGGGQGGSPCCWAATASVRPLRRDGQTLVGHRVPGTLDSDG